MESNEGLNIPERNGAEMHQQALEANEAGNFEQSLGFADHAMMAYSMEADQGKSSEIRAMRGLTLRRLYKETGDKNFLIDAKHCIMSGIEIARLAGVEGALSIPLFQLGKTHVMLREYEQAAESYESALAHLAQSPANRPSVEADMEANLETTKLLLGDDSAHERALESIAAIGECEDATDHEKGVWMAGGYMRLAEALMMKDREQAMEYMARASEIIERNPKGLSLVKSDLEKLKQQIGI